MSAIVHAVITIICVIAVALALYSEVTLFYTAITDGQQLCPDGWSWSLGNKCFRHHFLWPAMVWGGFLFVIVNRHICKKQLPFEKPPLRQPQGEALLVDNRTRLGTTILLLSWVQYALFMFWLYKESSEFVSGMGKVTGFTGIVAVIAVYQYRRSDPLSYAGMFNWKVAAIVAAQLLIGLVEIYYSFFTSETRDVPMWGADASWGSACLQITTLVNLVLVLLYSMVQERPFYMRKMDYATGKPVCEVPDNDDDTPLSRQKPENLVDTPEFSISWFSQLGFSWPNNLLKKGSTRQLETLDLYNLDPKDLPVTCWRRYLAYRKPGRQLIITLLLTFAPELIAQGILSLITTSLHFSGPFFLQRILRSIDLLGNGKHQSAEKSVRAAYLDAFGLLFFTLLASLTSNQTLWIGRHVGMRLKGLLVAELSTKTLRRRGKGSWEEEEKTDDEKKADEDDEDAEGSPMAAADGKIMNLLTADFQRVTEVSGYLDNIYGMPLMLIIGVWYMYVLLGVSALLGLSISFIYAPLSKYLFAYLTKVEEKLNALSDERVTVITELLQGIKAVKLFGWESKFLAKVDERRERQLKYMWKLLMGWVYIVVVSTLAPMIVLLIIFAVYVVGFGNTLTAEIAFTSISVFNLVKIVFEHLPGFLNWVVGGYVSLGRINTYLGQPQVQELESRIDQQLVGSNELGFDNATLEWEIVNDKGKQVSSASSSVDVAASAPTKINTPTSNERTPLLVTAISNAATASYTSLLPGSQGDSDSDDDMVMFGLKNIDVRFPTGGLSIIAGPTGSGKSSMLSALIGEMVLTEGRILVPTSSTQDIAGAGATNRYRDIIELSEEGLSIRDIAYVAQEAWLRNATIRENVLFGEPYDQSRYEEVLRVCALKPDLRILSAGDQTEIGERGVTLSGGQKQRVALARAVYSSRQILLIDDCLSAVDAHTAKHILMECLVNKSKLMHGRTRVLVTHHVSMCLPYAQYVVMLREGTVSMKGAPDTLQQMGVFSKVVAELEKEASKQEEKKKKKKEKEEKKKEEEEEDGKGKGAAEETIEGIAEETDKDMATTVNDMKPEDDYNTERLKKIAEQKGLDPNCDLSALQGTLIDDEEREQGYVKFSVWMTYLGACGNKIFWTVTFVTLVVEMILVVFQDYWIRLWVKSNASSDQFSVAAMSSTNTYPLSFSAVRSGISMVFPMTMITAQGAGKERHSAFYWLGIYLAIGVACIVWRVVQMMYVYRGALRASRDLHHRLIRRVVRGTPRFFDSTPLGRIINRFSRDMQTVDEAAMDTIFWWLNDIMWVISVFAIIIAVTPSFAVVAVSVFIIYAGIAYYYLNTSRELKRLESNSMSPLLSLFGELILGVSTIRAFGAKHYYIKEALNRINAHNRPFYMVWASNRWLSIRIDFAGAMVSFGCALFILGSLDWLDAGLAGFVLSYALTFSERMLWVVRNYGNNELNMNAIERVGQYLKIDQEAPLHVDSPPPAEWPATGEVKIENLVIEYVPGVPVLHDISLSVRHGEKIGVVGRTGAGKSSLSLALLRFNEARQGRILLDNVDISKIGLDDLRRKVTIIPQDPVLFNGTIRFNLDPFGEYPDELVWDALRRAHLVRERSARSSRVASAAASIKDGQSSDSASGGGGAVVERMSGIFNSLDAEIKENGQNLSLGQRQLVALARALVRRSRLIIMDEATASVDYDTDDRIQQTIRGPEFANSTLFCIAHRLQTIIDYDRVLVLDKGKVAEFDTPKNLLQNPLGIFRSMCEKSGKYEHLVEVANRHKVNK